MLSHVAGDCRSSRVHNRIVIFDGQSPIVNLLEGFRRFVLHFLDSCPTMTEVRMILLVAELLGLEVVSLHATGCGSMLMDSSIND